MILNMYKIQLPGSRCRHVHHRMHIGGQGNLAFCFRDSQEIVQKKQNRLARSKELIYHNII